MKTTNRTNQVHFIQAWSHEMGGSHRDMGKFEFSVTESLKDPTAIILRRRHKDDIEEDLQDTADRDAGTAVHESIEEYAKADGYICEKEVKRVVEIGNGRSFVLVGKFDCYNPNTKHLVDIKNTKLATYNKQVSGEDDEWINQQSLYVDMMSYQKPNWYGGLNDVTIEARITDLSVVKEIMAGNSPDKWRRIDWPLEKIKANIPTALDKAISNICAVIDVEDTPDEELPICSDKYRFATTNYKIYKYKKGIKEPSAKAERGHASYTSIEEAQEGFKKAGFTEDEYTIKKVGGESLKCKYYCECKAFCPHYKAMFES